MGVAIGTIGRAVAIWIIVSFAVGWGLIPAVVGAVIAVFGPIGGYLRARHVAARRLEREQERMTRAVADGVRRARVPAPVSPAPSSALPDGAPDGHEVAGSLSRLLGP